MTEEYIRQRKEELEKYPVHEPIFAFLRHVKTKDLQLYDKLLFFVGEIDDTDKEHKHTVWWCTDLKDVPIIRKMFSILCPKGKFELKDDGTDPVCFRIKWEKENQMHPIVFHKIIFPDFCILDKTHLDF